LACRLRSRSNSLDAFCRGRSRSPCCPRWLVVGSRMVVRWRSGSPCRIRRCRQGGRNVARCRSHHCYHRDNPVAVTRSLAATNRSHGATCRAVLQAVWTRLKYAVIEAIDTIRL
jgi:hypothetical protein